MVLLSLQEHDHHRNALASIFGHFSAVRTVSVRLVLQSYACLVCIQSEVCTIMSAEMVSLTPTFKHIFDKGKEQEQTKKLP